MNTGGKTKDTDNRIYRLQNIEHDTRVSSLDWHLVIVKVVCMQVIEIMLQVIRKKMETAIGKNWLVQPGEIHSFIISTRWSWRLTQLLIN